MKGAHPMAQTSINIRTDEELKKQFDVVCSEIGLTLSTAINIFMKTVVRQKRIPFPLEVDTVRSQQGTAERSQPERGREEFDMMM